MTITVVNLQVTEDKIVLTSGEGTRVKCPLDTKVKEGSKVSVLPSSFTPTGAKKVVNFNRFLEVLIY